jgi:glycolate oxidase FAD binding subunit
MNAEDRRPLDMPGASAPYVPPQHPPDPAHDVVDDVLPRAMVEPESPEDTAAALRWASAEGLSVVIKGSGTKIGWGRSATRIDVLLGTRRMAHVRAHSAGDLTASVDAGITLGALNEALRLHGQWLPVDPSFAADATIGGLLATNDSGPLRHRFGTVRDLVIGIQLATTDGRVSKAGGQVVKNVAGYDLGRLVTGSFGTLAAIVGATFKLSPLPAAWATLVVEEMSGESTAALSRAVAASQLEPAAFDLHGRRGGTDRSMTCLLRFAGSTSVVDAQIAAASSLAAGVAAVRVRVAGGSEEAGLWRDHGDRLWNGPGTVVRASWRPADIEKVLAELDRIGRTGAVELAGRLGTGAGLVRIDGERAGHPALVEELRRSPVLGNIVVLRASREVKAAVDVWGPISNVSLLTSVKRAVDPTGTLGAGRGPVGDSGEARP